MYQNSGFEDDFTGVSLMQDYGLFADVACRKLKRVRIMPSVRRHALLEQTPRPCRFGKKSLISISIAAFLNLMRNVGPYIYAHQLQGV